MEAKRPRRKHIKYSEGEWFAVPLKDSGYALGIIARGSHKVKGPHLGYFFGPRYKDIPDEQETWRKQPSEAILIAWFGPLGILRGTWPLILSTRPFRREEWPVPLFGQIDPGNPAKGWLVEYSQETDGLDLPIRRIYCDAKNLTGLPEDGVYGYEAIENVLTKLLSEG